MTGRAKSPVVMVSPIAAAFVGIWRRTEQIVVDVPRPARTASFVAMASVPCLAAAVSRIAAVYVVT